ncbi:MAG TPA: small ribosomal subunit Rsm22 family protein [Micropepsaceae bacterium]|nr:small ribosomal subunit Rsm22 family protein [Micropepsaceae bacterium]
MSGSELPIELRQAIKAFIRDIPQAELSRHARAMSESYRKGRHSDNAVRDDEDVAAYLATRLPATYAAVTSALEASTGRASSFAPQSLLDVGAGPGTASWAAIEAWPSLRSITLLDSNPRFLAAAETLAHASTSPVLRSARLLRSDVAALDPASRFDAVIAVYALGELSEPAYSGAVQKSWGACGGLFLIVEPGTPSGFARVLSARKLLLDEGANVVSPCAGAYGCPMTAPQWCHFTVRLARSRAHRQAKDADVPFEDEKFSYVAVARESIALERIAGRIVAPPRRFKPEMRLTVCADGAISEHIIPSRTKAAFKAAAKKHWGDAI